MLSAKELNQIAKARLKDSEVLFKSRRYDGAIYLCGYAVEVALKARICKRLCWTGFPETNADFKDYQSFRTHDLDVLLHISGSETKIKSALLDDWSIVATWDPQVRYKQVSSASRNDAADMILSSKVVLKALR